MILVFFDMMKTKMSKNKRFSSESLILGIISILSGIFLFLLMPSKSFGPELIEIIDPEKQFLRYAFTLFFLLLFGVVATGTSIVAIVTGIKDYVGIDRGLYIEKGRDIYIVGLSLGVAGFLLIIGIIVMWTVF